MMLPVCWRGSVQPCQTRTRNSTLRCLQTSGVTGVHDFTPRQHPHHDNALIKKTAPQDADTMVERSTPDHGPGLDSHSFPPLTSTITMHDFFPPTRSWDNCLPASRAPAASLDA
ncbi:hypothetical protein BDZ89DRAFT_771134 [Hymenopellis radicata]|nr:hypothetical protein BDZ89DRAFT_771134 [Hymenopellis radicata]